ncbi:MAG: hypothetical protein EBZ41_04590 [Actinobacteria bacterium]|nr:hypothetical protein [Actinomycetota bacterium]
MSITGFAHKGRGVGIRDHQLILPSVVCSTHVSRKIANEVGAITFAHQNGCGIIGIDVPGVDNFFIELANHPNVQSVTIWLSLNSSNKYCRNLPTSSSLNL